MYKETITYNDYNGVERTEDFYFNLNKAEVMEMELSTTGGLAEMIMRVVNAKDHPTIVKIFKDILLKAYGVKSADGRQFLKEDKDGKPLANEFKQTEAYSILFTKYATDADAAAKFVNGILPADANKQPVAAN